MDFPITLDPKSKQPLWKQLSLALKDSIADGRLARGQTLPSTRELSQLLGISRDTVIRSYEELLAQGYLEATTGAGTFVSNRLPPKDHQTYRISAERPFVPQQFAVSLSQYAERLLNVEIVKSTSADLPEINYGAAPPDLLPAKQWREILMRHCYLQEPSKLDYVAEIFGYRPLREAIVSYLRRSKAIQCTADQVAVFSGSQHAHDLIARVLIDPGDGVAFENPGYCGARENFLSNGAQVYPISVDEDGLVTAELNNLPSGCKLVYVTPSHQDPTGAVMSLKRRQELLHWARDRGAIIIEDAFDSDYRYGSQPMPALQGLDKNNSVIYLYSFWKIMFPIVTAGCMVLPRNLTQVFSKAKLLVERNFPIVEHYALTDFLTEGHLERHIRKTRSIYAERRQALIFSLAQNFKKTVSYFKESAGLHLLVRFDLDTTEDEILKCAHEAGLPMVSTRPYYVENAEEREFLIGFAALPEDITRQSVERLASLLSIHLSA